MDKWKSGSLLPEKCRQCSLLQRCGGGCRMEAKMSSNGDFTAMDPYSNPEDVSRCIESLQAPNNNQQEEGQIGVLEFNQSVKWREESFGAIVMAKGSVPMFLSHGGFQILHQIESRKTCFTDDPLINWGRVDSGSFIRGLLSKKIVLPQNTNLGEEHA